MIQARLWRGREGCCGAATTNMEKGREKAGREASSEGRRVAKADWHR